MVHAASTITPRSHLGVICLSIMGIVVWVRSYALYRSIVPKPLCPVPMTETTIKTLYVFVEIAIDSAHLAQTVRLNFSGDRRRFHESLLDSEEVDSQVPAGRQIGPAQHLRIEGPEASRSPADSSAAGSSSSEKLAPAPQSYESTRLALVSTIQFVAALSRLKDDLTAELPLAGVIGMGEEESGPGDELEVSRPKFWAGRYEATIPRSKPLSPGEILGCTAPRLGEDVDALMYVRRSIYIAFIAL